MEAPVSTRAALLQALAQGPGYGVLLARRVREASGGQVRLGAGNVYSALRQLARDKLVRSWSVVPRGRRGARSRRYYELTVRGVQVATAQREALAGLIASPPAPRPTKAALARMRDRLLACNALSADTLALREGMRRARR
jgi:DNA-binding PadR family transcriptional regulator